MILWEWDKPQTAQKHPVNLWGGRFSPSRSNVHVERIVPPSLVPVDLLEASSGYWDKVSTSARRYVDATLTSQRRGKLQEEKGLVRSWMKASPAYDPPF